MEPKNDTAKYIVGIIIIGLVIVAVSLANRSKNAPNGEKEYGSLAGKQEVGGKESAGDIATNKETATMPKGTAMVEINYTDENGFTPDKISVKVDDTVKFTNKSSGKMWVGGDEHPTHTEYNGTSLREHCATGATSSFDQCGDDKEYSFTFTKAGSFDYHNHLRPRMGGTITVK